MVTRRALIIGSPDEEIPGVNIDIQNLNTFLLSPIGGAWRESEIINLNSPTLSQVRANIDTLKYYDYSFVFYAGHGYHSEEKDSTILNINNNQTIDNIELLLGAKKHTLILDCCRVLRKVRILTEAFESLTYDSANYQKVTRSECRYYFDKTINDCDPGVFIINSCKVSEVAGENDYQGGFYTSSLIKKAKKWSQKKLPTINLDTHYATYSLFKCHHDASEQVIAISGKTQHPTFSGPRSVKSFPFAIVA